MNKLQIIYVFIILICFSNCGKFTIVKTLDKTLINKTTKKLYYKIETNVKLDSIYSMGLDSMSMHFELSFTRKRSFLAYEYLYSPGIIIQSEVLYNLTDTTKFIRNVIDYLDLVDSFYVSHLIIDNSKSNARSEKLVVIDTLFTIFQKDTTMLTKFKDYYK